MHSYKACISVVLPVSCSTVGFKGGKPAQKLVKDDTLSHKQFSLGLNSDGEIFTPQSEGVSPQSVVFICED
jgi:hypothetical protein